MLRTLGLADWDVPYLRDAGVVATVRERLAALPELPRIIEDRRAGWDELEGVTREAVGIFAEAVDAYSTEVDGS